MNLMLLGEKRVTQLECPSCVHYRCACFCCFVPALRCTIVELLHNELRLQLPVIIYTHTLVHTFKAKVFLFTKRFFSYAKFTFDFGRFIFSVVSFFFRKKNCLYIIIFKKKKIELNSEHKSRECQTQNSHKLCSIIL